MLKDPKDDDDQKSKAYNRLFNGPEGEEEQPGNNFMSTCHHHQEGSEPQRLPPPPPTQSRKAVSKAYDGKPCSPTWFETITTGLGAISNLYYPVNDMDVLEEATAMDGSVKRQQGHLSRFSQVDDEDALLLDELSFSRRR